MTTFEERSDNFVAPPLYSDDITLPDSLLTSDLQQGLSTMTLYKKISNNISNRIMHCSTTCMYGSHEAMLISFTRDFRFQRRRDQSLQECSQGGVVRRRCFYRKKVRFAEEDDSSISEQAAQAVSSNFDFFFVYHLNVIGRYL